jgi:hypothetical protein
MLFIEKSKPPRSLLKFVALQKSVNLHPSYKDLRSPYIDDLDLLLYKEQKGLCCYCMQFLPKESNLRTREHFLPQSKFKFDEISYYNLYLACTEKDGTNSGHCDKTKSDTLISKYIGHPECDKGEILPQKLGFEEWEIYRRITTDDIVKINPETTEILPQKLGFEEREMYRKIINIFKTNPETTEILATINILGLNQKELVKKRKDFISDVLKTTMIFTTKQQCEDEIQEYRTPSVTSPKRFAGVAIYFLKERLKQLA